MTREEAIKIIDCYDIGFYDLSGEKIPADKLADAFDMAIEALSAKTDLISRADAIEAVKDTILKRFNLADWYEEMLNCGVEIEDRIKALPSAEAEQTVIRSRTLMPTKDFKEWAKRIRDENPNVIVIPCDAEVVSADAGWIPCSERLPSDDEYVIVSVLDDHGDTPWKYTTVAWLCNGVWISDNEILFGTAIAWQPLPKPYKGGDSE